MNLDQAVAAIRDGSAQVKNVNCDAFAVRVDGHVLTMSGLELHMNPRDDQRVEVLRSRLETAKRLAAHDA